VSNLSTGTISLTAPQSFAVWASSSWRVMIKSAAAYAADSFLPQQMDAITGRDAQFEMGFCPEK
jgi:hypothetical protein